MKLRLRLALAFFLVSVVPLAIVTAYSYVSSAAALKRAEETQADRMAVEMRNRVGQVLTEIGDRVDRLWMLRGEAGATGLEQETQLREAAVTLLAEAAPIVRRIDIVPSAAAPAPPAPRPPAQSRAPRNGPGARGPRGPRGPAPIQLMAPFSVELHGAGASGKDPASTGVLTALSPEEVAAWTRAFQRQADRVRPNDLHAAERQQHMSALATGEALTFLLHRGSDIVGRASATVSRTRLIETVLSLARRDHGELPFVVDADGRTETLGAEARTALGALHLDTARLAADASPTTAVLGDYMVVMRRDPSGIVFGIARPIGGSLREMRRASLTNLGLGALLIALAFVAIIPLSSRLTRDLRALIEAVRRLTRGDRSARVTAHSTDEVGELGGAFNRMAAELETHDKLLVEQERLRRELELCRQIQNDMLPHGPLRLGLTEMTGVSVPAREVGGDFFNYFVLPGGDLALLVGDVSGKGVGAALMMANIQATLRAKLPLEADLVQLVDTVDREVAANTPPEVFVTLFVGILDQSRRVFRYVNAGHNPQFLVRGGGTIEMLPSTGMPVGLWSGRGYEERTIDVREGDLLFLYTDGAVEAENAAGEAFGTAGLEKVLRGCAGSSVDDILIATESALAAFRGSVELFDDATMMVVRLGAGASAQHPTGAAAAPVE